MGEDHLTVLLLKFRAPAAFSICLLCLIGCQDSGQGAQKALYVGQPRQEMPCLFYDKHGDAQV